MKIDKIIRGGYLCIGILLCLIVSCVLDEEAVNQYYLPKVSSEEYNISPDGSGVTFLVSQSEEEFSFQWYETSDGTLENAEIILGETSPSYYTGTILKGIHYYFCKITSDSEESYIPFSVAFTGLPLVEINTVDNEEPSCEYISWKEGGGNYGATLKNATKVPGRLRIVLSDGLIMYDSGEYKEDESGMKIKYRGNTSAYPAKKPYKIKLEEKDDLLKSICVSGDQNRKSNSFKDKNWILLKDATSLKTFVGLTVSDIAGISWTPEFAFVDVVMNGTYRGIYLLIESVNKSVMRANVKNDGYIIERDAYWWNTDVRVITELYNQKYTFKYPDEDDITQEQLAYIADYFSQVEKSLDNAAYEDFIDVESFSRWLLVHDILGTWDSCGSNIYISKYDSTEQSKLVMSTPWDFDSNYIMKNAWSNVHNSNRIYSALLLSSENTAFIDSYKEVWENIKDYVWPLLYVKLELLNEKSGENINISREYDSLYWETSYTTIEHDINKASEWFKERVSWLKDAIGEM